MYNRYVEPALEQTIQDLPDAKRDGAMALWLFTTQRGPILPPWGTRERERVLRLYDRHEYNTLWQGAKMGLVKKWQSIPWVIDGGKTLTNQYQQILFQSQFGYGWDDFIARVSSDFLSFDAGAFIEIIGAGDPMEPPKTITGLSHLDSYYCLPTGDPEFPVVYWSRYGKLHLLHHSRVIRLVDMPDGDQNNPGYGHCALSRAIAVVERELNMQRYIVTELSDIPSPGAVIANNLSRQEVDKAFGAMRQQQSMDSLPDWGRVAWFYNMDTTNPASMENFTFARPPVNFDWNTYVQIDVDMLALALGVDRQDLWPLQTRAMGSGAQSEILAEKAKGKTFGQFLVMLERRFNDFLPSRLEFSFKTSDPQQSTMDANAALAWANTLNIAGPRLSLNEGRALLSNQSEMINAVVTDDAGMVIELDDTSDQPLGQPTLAPDTDPAPPAAVPVTGKPTASAGSQKDFSDTASDFSADFIDLVHGALSDDLTRRRAGTVLRAQLNQYGKQARVDGLKDGGVEDGMDDEDRAEHLAWLAQQSAYVSGFMDEVYGKGLTDDQVDQRATLWVNKSLQSAYYGGLTSADKNGMYAWILGATKEHCDTCAMMSGQTHRLKDYVSKGILPQSNVLDCGGYQCKCSLRKVHSRSNGNWATINNVEESISDDDENEEG